MTTRTKCPTRDDEVVVVAPVAVVPIKEGVVVEGATGGRLGPGSRPVDEGTRIDISKILSDFQASDEQGMWWRLVTRESGR